VSVFSKRGRTENVPVEPEPPSGADVAPEVVFHHGSGLPEPEAAATFISGESQWVYDHYVGAPEKFAAFAATDLTGKTLLDVGCGDGLLSFGLTNLPLSSVVGLDIVDEKDKTLAGLPDRIAAAGFDVDPANTAKFRHAHYDGKTFPFADGTFDIVFSWGAFEHIHQPEQVLAEMRRVMRPDGFGFVTVFPWYHCRYGSHLSDFVDDPYFHLTQEANESLAALEAREYASAQQRSLVLHHLWGEYQTLNKLSADDFYEAIKAAGLVASKVELLPLTEDLTGAPKDFKLSQLLIAGCTMLLRRA
jgi:SAM-dependent methyltransferase